MRVSTGECAAGFLARCLSGPTTTALPSGITLELVDSRQTANLARREADMALRHQPPETGDFYISKAGTFACAVYRRRGADAGAWVTYTDEQAHYEPARWVQRQIEETGQPVALRASSMLMHLEAIRAGTGRGVLPCYVGDGHPLLERLTPPIPEIAAEYWIIVHRDLRRSACVRAVIDWMKSAVCRAAGRARRRRLGSNLSAHGRAHSAAQAGELRRSSVSAAAGCQPSLLPRPSQRLYSGDLMPYEASNYRHHLGDAAQDRAEPAVIARSCATMTAPDGMIAAIQRRLTRRAPGDPNLPDFATAGLELGTFKSQFVGRVSAA